MKKKVLSDSMILYHIDNTNYRICISLTSKLDMLMCEMSLFPYHHHTIIMDDISVEHAVSFMTEVDFFYLSSR